MCILLYVIHGPPRIQRPRAGQRPTVVATLDAERGAALLLAEALRGVVDDVGSSLRGHRNASDVANGLL